MFQIKPVTYLILEDTKILYLKDNNTTSLLLRKDEVVTLGEIKRFSPYSMIYKGKNYKIEESLFYFIKDNNHCFKKNKR